MYLRTLWLIISQSNSAKFPEVNMRRNRQNLFNTHTPPKEFSNKAIMSCSHIRLKIVKKSILPN
jgi:hypothetical protein